MPGLHGRGNTLYRALPPCLHMQLRPLNLNSHLDQWGKVLPSGHLYRLEPLTATLTIVIDEGVDTFEEYT